MVEIEKRLHQIIKEEGSKFNEIFKALNEGVVKDIAQNLVNDQIKTSDELLMSEIGKYSQESVEAYEKALKNYSDTKSSKDRMILSFKEADLQKWVNILTHLNGFKKLYLLENALMQVKIRIILGQLSNLKTAVEIEGSKGSLINRIEACGQLISDLITNSNGE